MPTSGGWFAGCSPNYGEYMADFFCLPQLPRRKARAAFSHLKGEEIIQNALKQGRGVILLSAHIGNWELAVP